MPCIPDPRISARNAEIISSYRAATAAGHSPNLHDLGARFGVSRMTVHVLLAKAGLSPQQKRPRRQGGTVLSPYHQALAMRLFRAFRSIPLTDLALRLGIPRGRLSGFFRGTEDPTLNELLIFSKALALGAGELIAPL